MRKSTVISLIKLLAIFIFFNAALRVEMAIYYIFNIFESSHEEFKFVFFQLLSGWIPVIIHLLFGYILWIKSEKISSMIILSEITNIDEIQINKIEPILYSLVGIYLLFNTIPELSKLIYSLYSSPLIDFPQSPDYKKYVGLILSLIIRIILSIWLILGANWWVKVINIIRNYKTISKEKSDGQLT